MKCQQCQFRQHDVGCYIHQGKVARPACRTCMAVYSEYRPVLSIQKKDNEGMTRPDGLDWFTPRQGKGVAIVLITKDQFKNC